MEVHHHPDLHHKKKNFKEYFLEFLMIFLAVTMGFFAESLREHITDRDREEQLIHSLANDIKADIDRLTYIIDARNRKEIRMDSLTLLLNSPLHAQYGNDIYYLASTVARGIATRFTPNDGTLQQLKNSGGLRLIPNLAIADSIIKYDVQVRDLLKSNDVEESSISEYRKLSPLIFDMLALDKMSDSLNYLHRPTDNPQLFSYEKSALNEINACIFGVKAINKAARRDCKAVRNQAINLLSIIDGEYHLKQS